MAATAPPVDILWYAKSPEVVMVAKFKARISPELALTTGTLKPGALLHGLVAAVAVTVGVPDIWTNPEEAEIIGTLNPGALDQGFVPAVAVMDPLIWISPEEAEMMGTLKPGALDQGFVAAVAVTVGVPEIWTRPLEADTIVTVPLIWTSPDEAETRGTLNPGALLHGLVAAVAVTVGVPLICTRPEEAETTLIPAVVYRLTPLDVTGIT